MPYFAGSFLVARSVLQDAFFTQAVVLLLQHDADGAFGLVVNRRAKVSEEVPFPIFTGGPCPSEGVIMLHGHGDWMDDEAPEEREVAPGIYVGTAALFERVSEGEADGFTRFRIFARYAGWGPDQLEHELSSGAWAVVPATGELLFDTPVEQLWEHLLPPRFPQPSVN